jgi:hypothetical protein
MNGKAAFVAPPLGVLAIFGVVGTALGGMMDMEPREFREPRERKEPPHVVPCSLAGINPAYHPEVFGSAASARQLGFVQAKDGTWHVIPNCRVK